MKSSVAAQAFKSITSRIHPQLPLSPKESQRLLNALTLSFNNQLDRDFPPADSPISRPIADASHSRPRGCTSVASSSSSSTTDAHLASILTSPLFNKPAPPPTPAKAVRSQLRAKSKHPITIFEDSVASGHATIDIATLCLNAFRANLGLLSESDAKSQIRDMSAGTRVLRWLWSSANIHAYTFAEQRSFLDLMSYFLVAEANESALWALLESPLRQASARDGSPPVKDIRRRKGLLLCSLVRAHLSIITPSTHPTTAALSAFLRATDLNHSSSNAPTISLVTAGALLSKKLVYIKSASHKHPVSASLYDRFIESCPLWDKSPSDRALYRVASLKLHHPVSPSARDALYFIRHLKQSPDHPFLSPTTDAQRADVFKFLFDTVHLLQKQAFQDDALWVMEFMQHSFPDHLLEKKKFQALEVIVAQSAEDCNHTAELALPSWRLPDLG